MQASRARRGPRTNLYGGLVFVVVKLRSRGPGRLGGPLVPGWFEPPPAGPHRASGMRVPRDEAVAFFGFEPLNGSLRHETSPSICIRNRTSRSRLLLDARFLLNAHAKFWGAAQTTTPPLATASLACHRSLRNVNPLNVVSRCDQGASANRISAAPGVHSETRPSHVNAITLERSVVGSEQFQ